MDFTRSAILALIIVLVILAGLANSPPLLAVAIVFGIFYLIFLLGDVAARPTHGGR